MAGGENLRKGAFGVARVVVGSVSGVRLT